MIGISCHANFMNPRLLIVPLALLLSGCEIPGMGPDPRIAQREAEGRAVGGACRQGLRSIEDCYALNEKAPKTAVYEGWKEMDAYMRENKLEGQRAQYGKDGQPLQPAQAVQVAPPEPAKPAEPKEEIVDDKKPAGGKAAAKR